MKLVTLFQFSMNELFACWVIFLCFLSPADFNDLSNELFQKKKNYEHCQTILVQFRTDISGPRSNFLLFAKLSAEDKIRP